MQIGLNSVSRGMFGHILCNGTSLASKHPRSAEITVGFHQSLMRGNCLVCLLQVSEKASKAMAFPDEQAVYCSITCASVRGGSDPNSSGLKVDSSSFPDSLDKTFKQLSSTANYPMMISSSFSSPSFRKQIIIPPSLLKGWIMQRRCIRVNASFDSGERRIASMRSPNS